MTSRKKDAGTTGADRGAIVGLFRNQADAERAIRDLKDAGIDESRIGVAMRDREGQQESAEDATERILGGAVSLLAGVGARAIPGLGPIIVGGALASAFAGGLIGALVTLGIPEADARYFETGLRQGSVLVTANAGSRGPEAREILRASGADLGGSSREAARDPDLFMGQEDIMVEEESWRGSERRYHDDLSYAGPERRLTHR